MPRLRSQTPIEISSSPEPEPTPRPGKRAQRTKAGVKSAIIELTDSEGDEDALFAHVRPTMPLTAIAGPSSRRTPARSVQPKIGTSYSVEEIPATPREYTKATASKPTPLFMPSDDENTREKNDRAPSPARQEAPVHVDLARTSPSPVRDEPQLEPERVASPEPDPQSTAMARILEIIPDVEPEYLLSFVTKYMLEHPDQMLEMVVEQILHALFEDSTYPKVDRMGKGKRKQTEAVAKAASSPAKKAKIDYADMNRPLNGGVHYPELALELLQTAFPFIPKPHLRLLLSRRNGLYAPTHISILAQEEAFQRQRDAGEPVVLPYNRRVTPYRPKGKGASKVDDELEAERKWLAEHLAGKGATANGDASGSNDADDEGCEDGIECGCCFSEYPFDKLVQCPETHLFCKGCMKSYAETLLGSHDPNIKCMDQSGCKALIPESELKRFLPEKLMALWERVKQRKDLEAAGLEDLEECPFCEWGCVIDNPYEKLLRCGNLDICGAVSCRGCKKLVTAAAERALREYKRVNPDVEDKDIKVDLPVAPPAPAAGSGHPQANYLQQMQRNAQALADQAAADLERLRSAEAAHRAMMEERQADIRLLNETMVRQPREAVEYAKRARDLSAALGHDQARWYQMRMEVQQAQLRMDHARAQVVMYGPLVAAPAPAAPVNVNMHPPALPPPVIPRAVPVARRPRAPARRRR
ncbi:hypothetical protein DXG03_003955 [Asterophora parasitica]|uniref:E3 ubiquitin-protein ligase RNF216 RING finger HC subclass domain-containing protein n=1 Tax=Asterophora parasitica TaxID=117018 RepID=A0A9P7G360_9AGAR|nr:hypothetical protein DXG03_003955 [Asterophora parasitica]